MDEPIMTNSSGAAHAEPPAVVVSPSTDANDERALAITRELFASAPALEVDCDPSFPDYQWRLITVDDRSSTAEMMEREQRWHERMRSELGTSAARYSLCVYPEQAE